MVLLALVVVALAAGAFLLWQARQPGAASETVVGTPVPLTAETETREASATSTPTLPVVSSGSVPGSQATAAPVEAVVATPEPEDGNPTQAASPPVVSPSPAATRVFARPPASTQAGPTTQATAPAATAPSASVPATTPAPSSTALAGPTSGPNIAALGQRLLELVNADRAANGLQPVAWDATAAAAGQRHSEEMAQFGFMSHWNMDGYGPEYRYSRAGGLDMAQENVYRLVHQWQDGRGAPIDDWQKVVEDAQAAWMHSPGHRANILSPEHTHLGVGIAYNAATGSVAMAQEFVNRYVTMEPLPRRARPGDRLVLRGALLPGSTAPLVNLAYEPFPAPMTLEELNKTGTYQTAAQHLSVPQVRTAADGRFVSEFTLPKDAPAGLYHVWVWVESPVAAERVQAVDAVVEVSG